uniref:ARAD1C04620p n=1 Tax=Blastobotrys adeninivorans TaxID=409370 RepID=A0A060T4I6_BLAAD
MKYQRVPPPPIPDLRFEASYRRAIAPAGGSALWIALYTIRDQLMLPLTQGFLWALILIGFRTYRIAAATNGSKYGDVVGQWFRNFISSLTAKGIQQ